MTETCSSAAGTSITGGATPRLSPRRSPTGPFSPVALYGALERGARELLSQQLEVDHHRVERILDLVRDAGREPAECGQLARYRSVDCTSAR